MKTWVGQETAQIMQTCFFSFKFNYAKAIIYKMQYVIVEISYTQTYHGCYIRGNILHTARHVLILGLLWEICLFSNISLICIIYLKHGTLPNRACTRQHINSVN